MSALRALMLVCLACVGKARRLPAGFGKEYEDREMQRKNALAMFLFAFAPGHNFGVNERGHGLVRGTRFAEGYPLDVTRSAAAQSSARMSETTEAQSDTLPIDSDEEYNDHVIDKLGVLIADGKDSASDFYESMRTVWSTLVEQLDDDAIVDAIVNKGEDADGRAVHEVIETLKIDVPKILHEEPHWDNFSRNFQVIDQSGARTKGLGDSKILLSMLRFMCRKFAAVEDIQIDFTGVDERRLLRRNTFRARWKIKLHGAGALASLRETVDVDVETIFHLTPDAKVDYLKISKCTSNGKTIRSWPEVLVPTSDMDNILAQKDTVTLMSKQLDMLQEVVNNVTEKRAKSKEANVEIITAADRGVNSLNQAFESLESFRTEFGNSSVVQGSSLNAVLNELVTTASKFNNTLGLKESEERAIQSRYEEFLETAQSDINMKAQEKKQRDEELQKAELLEQAKLQGVANKDNEKQVNGWVDEIMEQAAKIRKAEEAKAREKEKIAAEKARQKEKLAAERKKAAAEKEKARIAAEQERERQLAEMNAENERLKAIAEAEEAEARELAERKEREEREAAARKEEERLAALRVEDIGQVVMVLKRFLPTILRRKSKLLYLADDFKVIDQNGATLNGKDDATRLLDMMRWIRNRFNLKEEIRVDFVDSEAFTQPLLPRRSFTATWRVIFDGGLIGRLARRVLGRDEKSLILKAVTVFHFNDRNKLDYVRISSVTANGEELNSWPEVQLVDNPGGEGMIERVQEIQAWVETVRERARFKKLKRMIAEAEAADAAKAQQKKEQKALAANEAKKPLFAPRREDAGLKLPEKSIKAEAKAKPLVEKEVAEAKLESEVKKEREEDEKNALEKKERKEDVTIVLTTLQKEIPLLLRKEPSQAFFSEGFNAMDELGSTVTDLREGMLLLKFVRTISKKFSMTAKIDVGDVVLSDFTRPLFPQRTFTADWQIRLTSGKLFGFGQKPVTITAKTLFHLDDNNRIDYVKFRNCIANGLPLKSWPIVTLSDLDSVENVENIENWLEDITAAGQKK